MNTHNMQQYRNIGFAFVGVALLGLAIVPFTAQALTATTTINSTIGSVISLLTTSGTVTLDSTPTGAGVQTTAKDTVTVSTNNSTGYNLSLKDTDATTGLVSGANTIAAAPGTFATPLALTANTWGYRIDGAGGFGAGTTTAQQNVPISGTIKYAGVTATDQLLKTTATTAATDTTGVWYSLAVDTTKPTGAYTDGVTYTALTN